MADRRKKKKKEIDVSPEDEKPAKIEYEIAKYLRNKLPDKKTFLLGHKVDYFIASKAIDCLLDSKWAVKDKNQTEALFTTRESVEQFMEGMLIHKFFHRAKKIIVSKDSSKKKQHSVDDCCSGHSHSAVAAGDEVIKEKKKESKKQKEKVKDKESKEKDKDNEKDKEKNKNEKDSTEKDGEKKKEKKKIKLDMHLEQIFIDANEPYVWIYDPVPLKAWFIGFGLVFGAVAICLFPLWPKTVRNYVYYLSVAAAIFLFFIISLAVIRLVVFAIVVVLTLGRHHIWLLPNLTEDVGFFESFWPLYEYKYKGKDNKENSEKDEEGEETKEDAKETNEDEKQDKDENDDVELREKDDSENSEASDNGSQPNSRGSQSTGTSNGFEILDEDEVQDNEAKKDK